MKYIVENKKSNYKDVVDKIINDRKKEIFNFFNVEDMELPFNIYIYDSIEELVNGLAKRGFKKDPDYMCACHKDEDNSLNYFEPKDNPGDNEWSKEEYKNVIFHELIHGIQFLLYGTTPEWINEGIAKYLDGHYSKGIKWLLDNYINNNPIPEQREIEEEFGMHNYDSYDYAYLMVSYLIETLGKDKFLELLKDKDKLNKEKHNLLNRSIEYYNDKYTTFTKEFDIFKIEYTKDDLDYIDNLVNYLKNNYKDIMNFFNLKEFNKKIEIKLWNDINLYRNNMSDKYNVKIPNWEVGRGYRGKKGIYIDLLSFNECKKAKGHNNDKLEYLFSVLIHEFVHVCQFEYNDSTPTLTWFNEGLATNLSGQYKNCPYIITSSLQDILNAKSNYNNFYLMGKYLLNNYDKEYTLKLAKDKELLIKDTPKIYKETLKYCEDMKMIEYDKVNTPEELLEFMDKYIKYGIKDDDGNIYDWDQDNFQEACQTKWRLRDELDIVRNGYGHCWDQTEIERGWFKRHNYEYKTLFVIFLLDNVNPYVCHTYLIYKDKQDNKWCWFEHADFNNRGIHKYDTMEEAMLAQREKHIEFNKSLGLPMSKDIIDTIHVYDYNMPKLGCTNQGYLDSIFDNATDITDIVIKNNKRR